MKTLKITRAANANLQNKINMSVVFNYIRENEPTYRARISRGLNISAPAVSRIVDKLIDDGYVIETEKLKIHSGKRPTQLKINSDKCNVVGIDLVKERVKIALSDFTGKIIKTSQGCRITEKIDIGEKLIEEIEDVLEQYCQERAIEAQEKNLKAICVGVPAVVDIDTGHVTDAPLYSGLRNCNLKERLGDYFGVPIYVENVVKLSALGEKHYGEGIDYKDIIFIEVSNGIGAGIIVDNHLIRGTNGSAGEIGLSIVGRENLGYKVLNKGYLEKNASVETIVERANNAVENGYHSLISESLGEDPGDLTPSSVCQAAMRGDGIANEIITTVVENLALVTINLILILNPQIIVFGGDICNLPEVETLFIDPMLRIVGESIPFDIPPIKISSLGENAGVIGASFLAIESLLLGEFPYTIDLNVLR
jgi:predicted NBD/HSP70 family sugar kinase